MNQHASPKPSQPVQGAAVGLPLPQVLEQAINAYTSGALDRAEALCRTLLQSEPNHAEALHLLGVINGQTNRADEAVVLLSRSLQSNRDDPYVLCDLGEVLRILGRPAEALVHLDRVISLEPANAAALNNRGLALHALKRLNEALESYRRVTEVMPKFAEAWNNCGRALADLGRFPEALECIDRAIQLDQGYAQAHLQRGNVLTEMKRSVEAVQSYDRALALDPMLVEAHNNRGIVLFEMGRREEALEASERAIALRPDFAEAFNNRGNVLRALRRHSDALESYDRAIGLRPDFDAAFNNRGSTLRDMGRLTDALDSYDKAIRIRPGNAHAFNNRGAVLQSLNRYAEAVASYEKAIALMPEHAEAHNNRGLALARLRRNAEALESFRRAITLNPKLDLLPGNLLFAQLALCDWSEIDARLRELEERIWRGENVSPPYAILALTSSPALQRKVAENHIAKSFPLNRELGAITRGGREKKIRIGYFSADFRNHVTSYLTVGLFETHDKSRFELTGFYFGPDVHDSMRSRVSAAFDRFIDVRTRSEREIAQLSRDLKIDIAVDLMGFTDDARTGIFAFRAAPVQVIYLGYPGTMGAEYIDYVIADKILIPEANRQHFSEKIVFMPHSVQPNDRKRQVSDRVFKRSELGLPPSGFVFCCFHSSYKIRRNTFDVWMRILKRVRGSVLWLREDSADTAANLRKEAERNGVPAERLIFAPRFDFPEHLARLRHADLFLDTYPFNAHTTASEALWAGLPILTCAGEAYISRVAASLLNALGLPELITRTQDEYEALATELAGNPEKLARIRQKVIENRLTTPLFDTSRYARHLEAAYVVMHERYHAGLAPDHIEVGP